MNDHKFKVGDLVVLISKSQPSLSGHYFVRAQVIPSAIDINARTGEPTFEPLYLLEGLGEDLWLERCLSLGVSMSQ